jgi:CSLREA domain-containing protein
MRRTAGPKLLASLAAIAFAPATFAATITVNSPADENSFDPPNTSCTLREALLSSHYRSAVGGCAAGTGVDTIVLPAGTYALTKVGDPADDGDPGELGDLDVDGSVVTIQGAGAATTSIDAGALGDRVLQVKGTLDALTLRDLTILGGSQSLGGGLYTNGALTLERVHVTGNVATAGGGLFVSSTGSATIVGCTVSDGVAESGAGIFNAGAVTLLNSTVSGNHGGSAFGFNTTGGGFFNASVASLTLASVTVFGNTADDGPAIYNQGTVSLVNSLLAGAGASACKGTGFTSLGHDVDEGVSCGVGDGPGDVVAPIVAVQPLADNGGPTPTHALGPGSAALDAGDPATCPAADQRGVARPQDGDGDGLAACDVGAFEAGGVAPAFDLALALVAVSPDPVVQGSAVTFQVTVSNGGASAAAGARVTVGLRGGLAFASGASDAAPCEAGPPVTCSLGALPAHAAVSLLVTATATAAGDAVADFVAGALVPDPDPGNDLVSARLSVNPGGPTPQVDPTSPTTAAPAGGGGGGRSGGCGSGGPAGALAVLALALARGRRAARSHARPARAACGRRAVVHL